MTFHGKLMGLALSAATLLAFLPAGAANAAESNVDLSKNESITINSESANNLAGHKFKPVLVGSYEMAVTDGTNLTGVSIKTEDDVMGSATRAFTKANDDHPASGEFAGNPIGAAASKWLGFPTAGDPNNEDTTSADGNTAFPYSGTLRNFVMGLTAQPDKGYNPAEWDFPNALAQAPETTAPAGATSVTLNNLKPGLYVVIDTTYTSETGHHSDVHQDSGSIPMMVGTKAGGMSFVTEPLGVINLKNDYTDAPVKTIDPGDANTTHKYGDKIGYTLTSKVPLTTGYHSYMFKMTDTPSPGLQLDESSVKVTINGKDIPLWASPSDTQKISYVLSYGTELNSKGGRDVIFDLTHCIQNQPYKAPIKITYKMEIVPGLPAIAETPTYPGSPAVGGATSQLSNGVEVEHTNCTSDQPNLPNYGIGGCTTGPIEGNTVVANGPSTPGQGGNKPTNGVNVYHFDLVNESKATNKELVGAHFKVTDESGKVVSFYQTAAGKYGAAVDDFDGATTDLVVANNDASASDDITKPNAKGHLDVDRLDPGTYTVEQTKNADGFSGNFLPKFQVTIKADTYTQPQAEATFIVKADQWGLVKAETFTGATENKSDPSAAFHSIVVYSVNGISQLPLTGGAGVILGVTVAALLLIMGGALIVMKRRNNAMMA